LAFVNSISGEQQPPFVKMTLILSQESKSLAPPLSVLDGLTPDDARQLVVAEDELATSRR
jgi:hypothetical protein